MLPAVLGRLHPRFKTPYLAFVAMGVVSTVILVGGALLSNSQSNVFWMTFRLTALTLLLCYLLVFPAFLVLRRKRPDQPRPYRLPGGRVAAATAAWVCTLYIFGACVLFFVPSPTAQEPLKEGLMLGGLTIVEIVIGYLLIPRKRAGMKRGPAGGLSRGRRLTLQILGRAPRGPASGPASRAARGSAGPRGRGRPTWSSSAPGSPGWSRRARSRPPAARVVILDARDRVGGRVKAGKIAGQTVDLGGQWVGPKQTRLLALLARVRDRDDAAVRPRPRRSSS